MWRPTGRSVICLPLVRSISLRQNAHLAVAEGRLLSQMDALAITQIRQEFSQIPRIRYMSLYSAEAHPGLLARVVPFIVHPSAVRREDADGRGPSGDPSVIERSFTPAIGTLKYPDTPQCGTHEKVKRHISLQPVLVFEAERCNELYA
jgi:hypothetical protein